MNRPDSVLTPRDTISALGSRWLHRCCNKLLIWAPHDSTCPFFCMPSRGRCQQAILARCVAVLDRRTSLLRSGFLVPYGTSIGRLQLHLLIPGVQQERVSNSLLRSPFGLVLGTIPTPNAVTAYFWILALSCHLQTLQWGKSDSIPRSVPVLPRVTIS